jgi:hypothetical protein
MHQVDLNALLHVAAAALWEGRIWEVLFASRTGKQLPSPGRDLLIRMAVFHCHLANRFIRTTHCIPPIVQYTWRFVISPPSLHVYFYCQKTYQFFVSLNHPEHQ